jgi:hypothetical protein
MSLRRAFLQKLNNIIPLSSIISEYKFNNNTLDTVGNNNGTSQGLTYVTGIVDEAADLSSGGATVPDSTDLRFTDGVSDLPFSISVMVYNNDINNSQNIVDKGIGSTNLAYQLRWRRGNAGFEFTLQTDVRSKRITIVYGATPIVLGGQWYSLIVTYDGSQLVSGMKMYIDGLLVSANQEVSSSPYTGMNGYTEPVSIGMSSSDVAVDCLRFWDAVLSSEQAYEIATKELAGVDINP